MVFVTEEDTRQSIIIIIIWWIRQAFVITPRGTRARIIYLLLLLLMLAKYYTRGARKRDSDEHDTSSPAAPQAYVCRRVDGKNVCRDTAHHKTSSVPRENRAVFGVTVFRPSDDGRKLMTFVPTRMATRRRRNQKIKYTYTIYTSVFMSHRKKKKTWLSAERTVMTNVRN